MSIPGSLRPILNKEIVKSEKRRLDIFIVFMIVSSSMALIFSTFYRKTIESVIYDFSNFKYLMIWSAFSIFLLVVARVFVANLIHLDKRLHQSYGYISTTIETLLFAAPLVFIIHQEKNAALLDSPAVFIFVPLIIVSTLHLDFGLSIYTGLLVAISYGLIVKYATEHCRMDTMSMPVTAYYMRSLLFALSGAVAGAVAKEIRNRIFSSLLLNAEKEELERLFSQQVSKEVASALKEITDFSSKLTSSILFLDIRGFTHITQTFSPEEIVQFQNDFFTPVMEIIEEYSGVTNQILGDGIMATFGAPIKSEQHQQNAYDAAVKIYYFLNDFRLKYPNYPIFRIGMGIHCGEILVSNIGSKSRKQFSVSGLPVIISARLEQLTKSFNAQLLVSSSFYRFIKPNGTSAEFLGEQEINGVKRKIEVVKLL